jgi:hypothetical protein
MSGEEMITLKSSDDVSFTVGKPLLSLSLSLSGDKI